jgi:hypothetical protein
MLSCGFRRLQESCAGTLIGQEIWKLVMVDTVVSILQRFGSTFFFKWWFKRRVQLEVVQSVLALVYRQGKQACLCGAGVRRARPLIAGWLGLIWVGMVFCPALPILAMISNMIYFYFFMALVSWLLPAWRWRAKEGEEMCDSTRVGLLLGCIGLDAVAVWLWFQVRGMCRPPDKRFTQNRNNTFFMMCLALTLFFVAIPLGYALKV